MAAGVASSMAQSNVYSLNIVGYVNVPVTQGNFYLLNNPLDVGGGDIVTNVFPITDTNFDSSYLYTYDQVNGLNVAESYIGGYGWYPGTTAFVPGTGFYLYANETTTVTFTGSVVLSNTIAMAPGFSLVGSAYPASTDVTTLGLQGHDSDYLYRWDAATASLDDISSYIGGYGWYETINGNPAGGTGGSTNGPTLNVAEGFFYYNSTASNNTWSQSFTVN